MSEWGSKSNSWGATTAERLRKRDEEESLKLAARLKEQELINHLAPNMWQELKDKLVEMTDDLNRHYGKPLLMALPDGIDKMFIQSEGLKVELRFDNAIPEITLSPALDAGRLNKLKFAVQDREVLFECHGPSFTVSRTAELILDRLV